MTCAEFKENVAAFVLGALEPDEHAACEAHLAETRRHEGCHEEVRRATEAAGLLAASLPPVEPRDRVWDAIAAEIGLGDEESEAAPAPVRSGGVTSVRPASRGPSAPRHREPAAPRRGGRWREGIAWTLAAAGIAAAVFLGAQRRILDERLGRAQQDLAASRGELAGSLARLESVEGELGERMRAVALEREACVRDLASMRISLSEKEAALELLGSPGTQLVQLAAQGDVPYRASALVNSPREEGLVLASALEPQAGKDYQLWLIRGDRKISAGLLPTDDAGLPTLARISRDLLEGGAPDAFAITVEPAGGMPQPTGPIVLVGKVKA